MPGPGPRGNNKFAKPKDAKKTIFRLLGYLSRSKLPLVFVALLLLTSVAANLAGSYYMRPFINMLVGTSDGSTDFFTVLLNKLVGGSTFTGPADLLKALIPLGCIYLVGALASYLQSVTMARLAEKGTNRLRKELFDALQTLPISYYDGHTHGELMSRFTNDADNVGMALRDSIVSLFSSAIMFVGLVCIMIYTNAFLFLITVVILALTFLVIRFMGSRSQKYHREQQAALGKVNGNIQEMIEGLKVVKAFTHEEEAKANFTRLNEDYRQAATAAQFYSSAVMPIAGNLNHIGYAFTAMIGGLLAIFGGFDIGGFTVYLNYTKQVSQPLNQISQQINTILSALAGAERIFEVMDTAPEVDQGAVTLVPAHKDQNGTLSINTTGSREGVWAWRTPKNGAAKLVPILTKDEEGTALELAQATKEGGSWRVLDPDELCDTPQWGTLSEDGSFTPVADAAALSGHRWAWKYPDHEGKMGFHLVRGAVRNIPGEDYYLTELKGAVRFNHVDFSYVPGKRILHDVTVYANPGQKIAFVGSTGAGKTTITNLINRFYEIEGGMITFDGLNVGDISKDSLRQALGAVLQDTHLFTGTVMDNIRYGRLDATDEECIQAAKTVGAHSFIRRLPDGYNTMVTGDGSNFSQGQRQLLAIARCAVADPPVMILDEATSSIDTRTEALVQQGMDALMEGRTVFVIAHRLSTVRNSDCIVVIEQGRIQEKGSHAHLLEEQGRYYQLYTGQFQLE